MYRVRRLAPLLLTLCGSLVIAWQFPDDCQRISATNLTLTASCAGKEQIVDLAECFDISRDKQQEICSATPPLCLDFEFSEKCKENPPDLARCRKAVIHPYPILIDLAEHMTVKDGGLVCTSQGLEIPLLDMRKKLSASNETV